MDIWSWLIKEIKDNHLDDNRLTSNLIDLPSYVVDNQHQRVEAVFSELMSALRSKRDAHPWLDIYARHWRLQSLILRRLQISEGLPLAVDLIERASRPETRDCPQAICAAQDLCVAYGRADGPGYAEERLQVSQETLSRIGPDWPCWVCINGELAGALLELDRAEEAVETIRRMRNAVRPYDRSAGSGVFAEIDALEQLGRIEEALAVLDATDESGLGDGFVTEKRLWRARLLARLDRRDEARAALPDWTEVSHTAAMWTLWSRATVLLDMLPHEILSRAAQTLADQGALWDAIRLTFDIAQSDLNRGYTVVGRASLDRLARWIPRLRKPQLAAPQLAALEARWKALPGFEAPEGSRTAIQMLESVAPDPTSLKDRVARAIMWQHAGHPENVKVFLDTPEPANADEFLLLGQTFLELGARERAEALIASARFPAEAHWVQYTLSKTTGQLDAAQAALDAALEVRPQWSPARAARGALHLERREWQAAFDDLRQAVEEDMTEPEVLWSMVVAATACEEWRVARDIAARLDFDVAPGDEPMYIDMGVCRVEYGNEDQEIALRTGPCTAIILGMRAPELSSRYKDEVIFFPEPLGDTEPPTFAVLHTTASGGFRLFDVDGVHPGRHALLTLARAMKRAGAVCRDIGAESYRLTVPGTRKQVQGTFLRIAWPADRPLTELDAALSDFAKGRKPLVWIGLLDALNSERAQHQRAIADRWGM